MYVATRLFAIIKTLIWIQFPLPAVAEGTGSEILKPTYRLGKMSDYDQSPGVPGITVDPSPEYGFPDSPPD